MPLSHTPLDDENRPLSCDLLIIGAGVVGLWIARLAMQAGLKVILLEKRRIGAGASGGLLGALMPHIPEQWDNEKQFQFEALDSLSDEVRSIEQETGLSCGYLRCGRLLPLARDQHVEMKIARHALAQDKWQSARTGYEWKFMQSTPLEGWPSLGSMPYGMFMETLAARINPRLYLAALAASLVRNVSVIEGDGFQQFEEGTGAILTQKGRRIVSGHTVFAAGHESFQLLGDMLDRPADALGKAVKGQAVLLQAGTAADLPLVFQDGTYVVPHDDGQVAVGSTSENEFANGFDTDNKLEKLIDRASALCPQLQGAKVLERWAGLRPKSKRRDPMIGFVPGHQGVLVATAGFKITFAIAHRMAGCILNLVSDGHSTDLPQAFHLEAHLTEVKA